MHCAPREAERSMCSAAVLQLWLSAARAVRGSASLWADSSVAGSPAEEAPNQGTRRNFVIVAAVAGRPPYRFIRSLRQRFLIQMGNYSGGRFKKEDLHGFPHSLNARGILLLSSPLFTSLASVPTFPTAPATWKADGFSGCGRCSGINDRLPLGGDERRPGAAVPPPAAGHCVQWTDRFPRHTWWTTPLTRALSNMDVSLRWIHSRVWLKRGKYPGIYILRRCSAESLDNDSAHLLVTTQVREEGSLLAVRLPDKRSGFCFC